MLDEAHPASEFHFSQLRLSNAISRLWAVVVVHNHAFGVSHVVGNSMSVGIKIFNIVGGLGFGGDLSRGCGQWQLGGQGPHLLRRLRMLAGVLGLLSRRWLLIGGIRVIGQ